MKLRIVACLASLLAVGCATSNAGHIATRVVEARTVTRKISSVQNIALGANASLNPGDVVIITANGTNSAVTCGGAAPTPQFQSFSRSSIIYYQGFDDVPMSESNCTFDDAAKAKNNAAQTAMTDCQAANMNNCQIIGDTITTNGTLGADTLSQFGITSVSNEVFVGCVAVATAKGSK